MVVICKTINYKSINKDDIKTTEIKPGGLGPSEKTFEGYKELTSVIIPEGTKVSKTNCKMSSEKRATSGAFYVLGQECGGRFKPACVCVAWPVVCTSTRFHQDGRGSPRLGRDRRGGVPGLQGDHHRHHGRRSEDHQEGGIHGLQGYGHVHCLIRPPHHRREGVLRVRLGVTRVLHGLHQP